MKTYMGCSGWLYPDWKGKFYPKDLPSKDYLSYYTTVFNSVEVNSTFYHFPTPKTLSLWYEHAPKKFKYSLKASRYITHIKRFKEVKEPLKKLYGISEILDDKMGYYLFQFPESFTFTDEKLERILSQLDRRYKNAVEFRHPSWWIPQVTQAFNSANIVFCSVSGFELPDNLIPIKKQAYLRFHGDPPYSSLYSPHELAQWVDKIKTAALKEVWVYFNNDFKGYAVQNALEFRKLLLEK